MIEQIDNTTFTALNLGDVKPIVKLGGSDPLKFSPNINMSFKQGSAKELYFLNLNGKGEIVGDESAALSDGVISQKIGESTHEYYIDDSGRLKWDKLFSSCPESMIVEYKVKKSKGVTFLYQGEPTAREIADGLERPEDVIGSYAVYCDKMHSYWTQAYLDDPDKAQFYADLYPEQYKFINGKLYACVENHKTGKLCHIPRPFVIDASGNREWCDMVYEEHSDTEGILYITMPKEFMQFADYSLGDVRLDPAIGYSTAGGSAIAGNNTLYSGKYNVTMSEAGTASKIYAYMSGGGSAYSALFGYYSGSSDPTTLADGNKSVSISSATAAWYSASVSGSLASGSKYYPSVLSNPSGGGYNKIYVDSGSSGDSCYVGSVSTMPSSYGTPTSSSYRRSFYLEYTVSSLIAKNYYYQQMQM